MQGPAGLPGEQGATGAQGIPGIQGAIGNTGPTGPIGTTGTTGATGLPGNVALGNAEPFEPGTQFPVGETVLYNSRIFLVTEPTQTGTPGSGSGFFEVAVSGGVTGATGPTGAAGTPGATGLPGNVALGNAEPFVPGTQFPIGETVLYNGRIFLITEPTQTGTPGSGTGFFEVAVSGGVTGATGPAGATGVQGVPGVQGTAGNTGTTGSQGLQGVPGPSGISGPQGLQGTPGTTGPQGSPGIQGAIGPQGPQGVEGPQGLSVTGATGPTGLTGATGLNGTLSLESAEVFVPGAQYPIGATILYNGSVFVVTSAPQGNLPGVDPAFSEIEIVGGITGPQGVTGATGVGLTGAAGATTPFTKSPTAENPHEIKGLVVGFSFSE